MVTREQLEIIGPDGTVEFYTVDPVKGVIKGQPGQDAKGSLGYEVGDAHEEGDHEAGELARQLQIAALLCGDVEGLSVVVVAGRLEDAAGAPEKGHRQCEQHDVAIQLHSASLNPSRGSIQGRGFYRRPPAASNASPYSRPPPSADR